MNNFSFLILIGLIGLVNCAPAAQVITITVEHIYPRAVTEPAWVTELLGPTLFPVTLPPPTRRPNLPQRIRDTIKQVSSLINQVPERINQVFEGIQKGAHNIIMGPGGPRTTTTIQPHISTSSKYHF